MSFWGMFPVKWPCRRKAGQELRGLFQSKNGWKSPSFLSAWKKNTMQVNSQDSVLKRPGRNQTLGRRFFGVPEDLHVSSIEKENFQKTRNWYGKMAPTKKRKHILDGSMDRKRPQNRDASLTQSCLTFSWREWQWQRCSFKWQQLLQKPLDVSERSCPGQINGLI